MNNFKPMSKKNARRAVLYGILSVLSLVLIRSWIFFLVFLGITIANVFLTQKSKQNEEAYYQKLQEAGELLGEDLTDMKKLRSFEKSEKEKGRRQLEQLMESYAAEDAEFDAYIEAENADDEYEYEYEEEDDAE